MWTCESCGTQGIAGDLVHCPVCGKERDTVSSPVAEEQEPATGFATGGIVTTVPVLVGEHGPEPIVLPPGAVVDPGPGGDSQGATDDGHEAD